MSASFKSVILFGKIKEIPDVNEKIQKLRILGNKYFPSEEYTEEEKMRIKEIFLKVAELNTILDKYDIEVKFDWKEYFALLGEIDIPIGG